MKNSCIISFLLLITISSFAQKDYSGIYGSSNKEKNKYLTVMKIDSTHYKFWAIASAKNYANNLDGIIEQKGDSIQYNYTEGNKVCPIHFKFSSTYAVVYPEANAECNFGFGKNIFATYPFIKKQKIKSKKITNEYIDYKTYRVTTKKINIYTDTIANNIRSSYFMKGIKVISPAINQYATNLLYIEFLAYTGDFIYGWIKKEDVKLIQ
ncbi:MAG: hypothetical protein JSR09_00275 [Bacteroidetes bacterium]|nr:hypothetical protein [Bacteroidota bacterium]MBS1648119.1 hypothetical protein [Bacteroidota bacterium]